MKGHTIEDLMFLFGKKKNERHGKFDMIRTEAENAWMENKDAIANPYAKGTIEHNVWHEQWYKCNINC
jgi:hypothetical protein